jgi:hypothetical protein
MLSSTQEWWDLLRGLAMLNLLAWTLAALWLWRRKPHMAADLWPLRRWQLLLSAGYVLGCGFRSALPVFDVQRVVLVDSFWSSVIVGRSVATVAELCFAAQWALLLNEVSRNMGHRLGVGVSRLVLPLIGVAELCSWYSVLTTSNIGHVFEETLWGLSAALLVLSVVLAWPRVEPARRPLMLFVAAAGTAYVVYMFGVDVPMYWARWLADDALGRGHLSVAQGLADASARWVVSHRWDLWRGEVMWMTTYFSVAVWLSIALVLAPRIRPAAASPP